MHYLLVEHHYQRGNIDMGTDEVGEDLGNTIFWPASNDQLELLQMVYLNPASEHMRETFIIILAR